jgi:hypothetical protein
MGGARFPFRNLSNEEEVKLEEFLKEMNIL